MGKTIRDELREICERRYIEARLCELCAHNGKSCLSISCPIGAADTLLAALEARGLEIRRKGEK